MSKTKIRLLVAVIAVLLLGVSQVMSQSTTTTSFQAHDPGVRGGSPDAGGPFGALTADELVFCVYPHYKIPDKDFGLLAKTVELLRQNPSDGLDPVGRIGTVEHVRWVGPKSPPVATGGLRPAARSWVKTLTPPAAPPSPSPRGSRRSGVSRRTG